MIRQGLGRLAVLFLLVCLGVLPGCGREQGLDFFGIGPEDDFAAVKAVLEERGFRFEGREGEPFLFIGGDFEDYYTFHGQTRLLARLKKALDALVEQDEGYEYFEPRFINSYIFQPVAGIGAEVGVGFSALTGKPLYIYYFTDDIGPELDRCRALLPEAEQVFPATGPSGMEYHYFESGSQLLILEKDPDGPSGGAICYFADQVEAFYQTMETELKRYGE